MDLKTKEMEYALFCHFSSRFPLITTNISGTIGIVNHECDLLMVSKSNYLTEIEIKVSLADLKKDFKKWHGHKDERIKYQYYALTEELYEHKDLIPENFGIIMVKKKTRMNTFMKKIPLEETFYSVLEVRKIQNPEFKGFKLNDKQLLNLYRLHGYRYWTGKLRELKYEGLFKIEKRYDLVKNEKTIEKLKDIEEKLLRGEL